jgi:two-component system, NarL family, response regulator YdfI
VTRVAVVAEALLVRAGLQHLLQAGGRCEIVAATSGVAALAGQGGATPAVVVAELDPDEPAAPWIDLLEAGVGLVLLVAEDERRPLDDRLALLARGASWLPADAAEAEILAAVEAAAAGLSALRPAALEALLAEIDQPARRAQQDLIEPLTARELEVLQLLAVGLGNKRIATRLAISEHTAKFHVGRILAKLVATSRTEAVAIGLRRRLIET